jgi:hypothetical protein
MKQRLHDVLEACQTIGRITSGLDFDDYMQNEAVRGGSSGSSASPEKP